QGRLSNLARAAGALNRQANAVMTQTLNRLSTAETVGRQLDGIIADAIRKNLSMTTVSRAELDALQAEVDAIRKNLADLDQLNIPVFARADASGVLAVAAEAARLSRDKVPPGAPPTAQETAFEELRDQIANGMRVLEGMDRRTATVLYPEYQTDTQVD